MLFSSEWAGVGRGAVGGQGVVRRTRPVSDRSVRPNAVASRMAFCLAAAGADAAAMLLAALLAGLAYRQDFGGVSGTLRTGLVITVLFVGLNALRTDYAIARYFTLKGHVERVLAAWAVAFGAALTLGFMTKTTAIYSRGAVAIFFVAGFAGVVLVRDALVRHVRVRAKAGRVTARTVVLVGGEAEINAFVERYRPAEAGLRVIGASVLRQPRESLADDLALAVATSRILRPDDIVLLLPWSEPETIARCVDAFRRLPAAIHLGPSGFLDHLGDLRADHVGSIASVHLVRSALSPFEVAAKRAFDVAAASVILVALSPVLALVALAIKLDSRGPVLFRQRRYGFNQEPFRIFKFRSMTTMEDGFDLRQVTDGDVRVTRLGRVLRKTSLDELPQLLNVLRGDMSLVGPRPHALAHDQRFERDIALYARRHNVRPGITGWAQVNGWRGETDTPEKIRGRVEHDLYYIDNWSAALDLSILVRTVLSPRTFKNAK